MNDFDRFFAQNRELVRNFTDFEEGRLAGTSTDFFYKNIAKTFIEKEEGEIPYAYIDIRKFEKEIRDTDKRSDIKLIALFKLLSPENLLKLPFLNDSNTLDKGFYTELLHIIGLHESKKGGKKLIGRKPEKESREN